MIRQKYPRGIEVTFVDFERGLGERPRNGRRRRLTLTIATRFPSDTMEMTERKANPSDENLPGYDWAKRSHPKRLHELARTRCRRDTTVLGDGGVGNGKEVGGGRRFMN